MHSKQRNLAEGDGRRAQPSLGLALQINQQNSLKKSSPVEPFARWFVPKVKKSRVAFAAVRFHADVVKDLSDLLAAPISEGVIFLDFFDTLVTRPVEPPDFVLGKVAEISVSSINSRYGYLLTKESYLRGRSNCEKALHRESYLVCGQDNEALLSKVLERFLNQLGVSGDTELLAELIEAEVSLESDVLALNSSVKEFLTHLRKKDKRVYVLSDMYLSSELLSSLSERLGISEYIDGFYVSGELGFGKHSGRLFEYVLKEQRVSASDVLHVGDNVHSDYKMPDSLGINAKWLYQPGELKRRYAVERRLRKNPERFVRQVISNQSELLYQQSEILEKRLFTHIAPAVFTMAYKSLRACISLGINKLYFLAREGITLRKVFECLIEKHPEFQSCEFQLRTLYCSRASTVCGRVPVKNDAKQLLIMVAERSTDFSFDSFLKAWNIDEARLKNSPETWPELQSRDDLLHFLNENSEIRDEILGCLRRDRDDLIAYLEQEGVPHAPCAFVDVGWSGSIQKNIDALGTGSQIYGMYLGTSEEFEARNLKGHIFSSSDYRTGSVHKAAPLTETLLSVSDVATTIDYERHGEAIRPVFKNDDQAVALNSVLRDRVFSDFYDVFHDLTRKYCIPTAVLTEHSRRQYFHLICHPDRPFLKVIGDLKFNFDWGREDTHLLVGKLSFADFFRPSKVLFTLWSSPWLFGTLKASRLGLLNWPLSWFLGHEELINRRLLRKIKPYFVKKD